MEIEYPDPRYLGQEDDLNKARMYGLPFGLIGKAMTLYPDLLAYDDDEEVIEIEIALGIISLLVQAVEYGARNYSRVNDAMSEFAFLDQVRVTSDVLNVDRDSLYSAILQRGKETKEKCHSIMDQIMRGDIVVNSDEVLRLDDNDE